MGRGERKESAPRKAEFSVNRMQAISTMIILVERLPVPNGTGVLGSRLGIRWATVRRRMGENAKMVSQMTTNFRMSTKGLC